MLPQLVRDNLYLQSGKYVHAGTSLQGRGAAPLLFVMLLFWICHGVMGKTFSGTAPAPIVWGRF